MEYLLFEILYRGLNYEKMRTTKHIKSKQIIELRKHMALLKMVLHLDNAIYYKLGNDYCKAIKNNITSIIKIDPEYAVKYYHPLFINDNADLKSLKSKVLSIDESICDVDDVISSIKSSTQTQEDKIKSLESLKENINEYISYVVTIDQNAADAINKSKNDFYDKYEYLKPDCEKSWLEEKLDNACEWCKECWKELLIGLSTLIAFIAVVAVIVSTWPYSGLVLLLFGITISCTGSVYNGSLPPPYTYDETFPQSMSDCLGINYSDYIKTMHYQYGFDEQIAILYLKLYLQVANDPSMRGKSEREIACEFNRIIASLCINYDGDAKRWRLTTGNYKSVDAYEMLINMVSLKLMLLILQLL